MATGKSRQPLKDAPTEPRQPRQERGQRRVEAILDAAAAIVAAEGVHAATMHAIARRSGTTIGSMYHFFPDRDAVLLALAERHGRNIGAVAADLAEVDWARLSVKETVERYAEALLGYVRTHPDLMPVAHAIEAVRPLTERDPRPEQLIVSIAERIVASRTPDAPADARTARAAMMLAAVGGVVERAARSDPTVRPVLERELKRMLVGYLAAFE